MVDTVQLQVEIRIESVGEPGVEKWFVEAKDFDYAVIGNSLENAMWRFKAGLLLTIKEHLGASPSFNEESPCQSGAQGGG